MNANANEERFSDVYSKIHLSIVIFVYEPVYDNLIMLSPNFI